MDPNIKIDDGCVFQETCRNGHLDIAKWLYKLNPNMKMTANKVLRHACSNGHLDVAKWIFQLNPKMKITKNHNIIFHETCHRGHLEVAKWLYQIDPNMNVNMKYISNWHDCDIFPYMNGQYSSVIDNPHMVKWFVEIGVEFHCYSGFHWFPKECKQILVPIIKPEELNKEGLEAYLIETNNVIPYWFKNAPPHAKIRGKHTKPAPRD